MELLFSYGTLQLPAVQQAVFGGPVPGEADAVTGHTVDQLQITDPKVIAASGQEVHPILVPTADPASEVVGTVFALTSAQLAAADDYEVAAYRRVSYVLRSGRRAWVYCLAHPPGEIS